MATLEGRFSQDDTHIFSAEGAGVREVRESRGADMSDICGENSQERRYSVFSEHHRWYDGASGH